MFLLHFLGQGSVGCSRGEVAFWWPASRQAQAGLLWPGSLPECPASPASSGTVLMPSGPRYVSQEMVLTGFHIFYKRHRETPVRVGVHGADFPLSDLHSILYNTERQLPWVSRKCLTIALIMNSLLEVSEAISLFSYPSGPCPGH